MTSPYLERALRTMFEASLDGAFKERNGSAAIFSFLNGISLGVLVTNAARAPAGPRIYFANDAFGRLCKYAPAALIGESPKMLHGADTDQAVATAFRATLEDQGQASMRIVNYDGEGAPYVAHVFGARLDIRAGLGDDLRIGLTIREDEIQRHHENGFSA